MWNLFHLQSHVRNSSYVASEKEKSSDSYTTFHKVSSENWKYVERLLPSATIPSFPLKEDYPSGWTPPAGLPLPCVHLELWQQWSIFRFVLSNLLSQKCWMIFITLCVLILDSGLDLPFFVPRNKNHMMPVYLNFEAIRRERKITIVRHIEGDIWVSKSAKL